MLRENVGRVDAIIFTHAHRDHTAGLDDVRAYNFMQAMDMPIYGTVHTLNQLKIEYAYVFDKDAYPGIPRLQMNEINDQSFIVNGVNILPLPVLHLKMPVLGFRFENFSYITDANFIPDSTIERLAGTEILVLNALQVEPHISHFNLDNAIKMVDRIRPGKTFFTHISHKLGLHSAIEKGLPPNTFLAYDGLELSI
jgi:phosphoribosyl 1,2-cyclic phosphate phosphodiesterase